MNYCKKIEHNSVPVPRVDEREWLVAERVSGRKETIPNSTDADFKSPHK